MDKHFGARWSHGGGIEVKVSMDLGVCQELWVELRVAEEVEGDEGNGEKESGE